MTRSLSPDWDDDRRPDGGDDPHGNLAPTDWKVVIVAALCGAALGWFTLSIYKVSDNTVPILPWSLPVVILVVAVATWGYARAFRAKVVDPKREVEANPGLVSLALGKAITLHGPGGSSRTPARCRRARRIRTSAPRGDSDHKIATRQCSVLDARPNGLYLRTPHAI